MSENFKPEFLRLIRLVALGLAVEDDAGDYVIDTKDAEALLLDASDYWPWCVGGCR